MFDLSGKTALVTGSTQGIGFAIAKALAEHGARVFVHGARDMAKCRAASDKIEGSTPVVADLEPFLQGIYMLGKVAHSQVRLFDAECLQLLLAEPEAPVHLEYTSGEVRDQHIASIQMGVGVQLAQTKPLGRQLMAPRLHQRAVGLVQVSPYRGGVAAQCAMLCCGGIAECLHLASMEVDGADRHLASAIAAQYQQQLLALIVYRHHMHLLYRM